MDSSPNGLARTALGAIAVLLLTLASNFLLGPGARLHELTGQTQPDLAFLATPSMLDLYLRTLGDAGRQLYARVEWIDFLTALMIMLSGTMIIRWLATHLPSDTRWPRILLLLPVLAGLLDVIENAIILRALSAYPSLSPSILPWITSTKLVLILLTLIAIAGLAAIALRLRRLAPVQL